MAYETDLTDDQWAVIAPLLTTNIIVPYETACPFVTVPVTHVC